MQRKAILILIIIFLGCYLIASEIDDLKFSAGLFADGNDKLAESELKNFLQKYPQSKFTDDAKYILANSLLRQEKFSSSQKIWLELYEKNYNPTLQSEIILGLAQAYYHLGNLAEAEKCFSEFQSEFPQHDQSSKALYFLGKIKEKQSDYETALSRYREAYQAANQDKSKLLAHVLKMEIVLQNQTEVDLLYDKILREGDGEYRDYAIILWLETKLAENDYQQILDKGRRKIRKKSKYFDHYKMLMGICFYQIGKMAEARDYLSSLTDEKAEYYFALANREFASDLARKIFEKLQNSATLDVAINSQFFLVQLQSDPADVIEQLEQFITMHSEHKFLGAALYQLGFSYFQQHNYQQAQELFLKAEQNELDKDNAEKLQYLLAECYYQLDEQDIAEKYLEKYLSQSANQKFRDQAIFKRALQYYEQKNFDLAKEKFQSLEDYPASDKLAGSYFYLAEIYFLEGDSTQAENYYQMAQKQGFDDGFIQLRLAKLEYLKGDYPAAEKILKAISQIEKYLYDLNLLRGNILLAQKDYSEALLKFVAAEDFAANDEEAELVIAQKAWSLYQLKRFEQASTYYQQLSGNSSEAEEYLYKAANAAFSAEKYQKAIELFTKFRDNFPENKQIKDAQIAIADSYYNLANYQSALANYKMLFAKTDDLKIIKNALAGMRWSSQLLDSVDLETQLDQLLAEKNKPEITKLILREKIDYLYEKGSWQKVIDAVEDLAKISSQIEVYDYRLKEAISYAQLQEVKLARETFQDLEMQNMTADLYYNWAQLELTNNQKAAALMLLKKGAAISQRNDIWLKLLELHPLEMEQYYQDFIKFAADYQAKQAELIWIEWRLQQKDYAVENLLNNLKQTKYKDLQAEAQYLLGSRLYLMQNYEEAIRELLRVRYLYPEINDTRIEAEYLACRCYLAAEQIDSARELYETIKSELPEAKQLELQKIFEESN